MTDFSWTHYCLPESDKLSKNVINSLIDYIYKLEDVEKLDGNLAIKYKDHIQVIIATATKDIPTEYEHCALEI